MSGGAMYCTNCGNMLNDGARFCTRCGAPAPIVDLAGASPAADSTPSEGGSKRRRNVVIAAIAAVVVIAVLVMLLLFYGRGGDEIEAYFGSSERIQVTRSTVVIPRDSLGEPLSEYTVSIESGYDDSGGIIDVAGYPDLVVNGTEGFTIGSIIGDDGDDGVYNLVVIGPNGSEQGLPPIEVDESAGPDTIYLDPDPQAISEAALFLDKLYEIVEEHGGPEIVTYQDSETVSYRYLAGLAYAGLIDFGDGEQRLVAVYADRDDMLAYDSDPAMEGAVDDYILEIWEVGDDGEALTLAWSGLAPTTNGGYPAVTVLTNLENEQVAVYSREASGELYTMQSVGMADDGEIGGVDTSSTTGAIWSGEIFEICQIVISGRVQTEDLSGYHPMEETSETAPALVAELEWLAGEESSGLTVEGVEDTADPRSSPTDPQSAESSDGGFVETGSTDSGVLDNMDIMRGHHEGTSHRSGCGNARSQHRVMRQRDPVRRRRLRS